MTGQPPPDFVQVRTLERNEDLSNHYIIGRTLGDGLFGETKLATLASDPTKRVALKIQPKVNEYFYQADPRIELLRLFKEVVFLTRILPKHTNIIEVKDVLVSPDNVYIVQELCEGTMETFYLHANDASARRVFKQLVEAIHVCHEHGIVHGDIKDDNILFLDRDHTQIKLIDFGCADYNPERAVKRNSEFDHRQWFNPDELIQVAGLRPVQDIKALGKVLHSLICGQVVPLLCSGMVEAMQTTYRPRTDRFSPAALHLLSQIGPGPFGPEEEREFLTIDQIRQHPWLTGVQFRSSKPAVTLTEQFELLKNDVRIVKLILREWMVTPMKILAKNELMNYKIVGMLQRRDWQTKIFLVMSNDNAGRHRAMKVIHGGILDAPPEQLQECIPPSCIYLELLITLRILPRHDNLVKIRDIYINQQSVALIKELLHTNTLEDFFPTATDASACRIFKKIANLVRHLHHHGVVHMNLRPEHIVFTDEEFTSCKVVNCSKALYVQQMVKLRHEDFEPERYLTPELLEQMASYADFNVDITALGRILHAMMCKAWEPDPTQCSELWPLVNEFHPDAVNLLTRIGPDPFGPLEQDRNMTIDDICNHPWLLSLGEA
ncbi:hypothetical protein R1flu_006384 [Riccia fluitans]|uniref:Protein kinase domain-containing protein n=1 Tax=Riccia fluitans TaxID=41844 RepID=A0ABD1YW75_9MARC